MPAEPLLHAFAVILGYVALCGITWRRYQRTRALVVSPAEVAGGGVLVAYASQSGVAERIARQSAAQLNNASQAVTVLPLNRVNDQLLCRSDRALFVVSTYGEGEPPDNGIVFFRKYLVNPISEKLKGVDFGVLALGDSTYKNFCSFGRQLHQGLSHSGARPLFDPIMVDREDLNALQRWQSCVLPVSGQQMAAALTDPLDCAADDHSPAYSSWQLSERSCINAGSYGAPIFYLRFRCEDKATTDTLWQSGDIAQVLVGAEGQAALMREYSIASLPQDGFLDLVVRQHYSPDGTLGVGSGWLTESLSLHSSVQIRLRSNTSFHGPPSTAPLILIGSGTGIAGLRAHIKARKDENASLNWLIFGERSEAHDTLFDSELTQWQSQNHLTRLDRCFSRDAQPHPYVQDVLQDSARMVRAWIAQGAYIYVCGSRQGMAKDVDSALREILQDKTVDELLSSGRYRRDIY